MGTGAWTGLIDSGQGKVASFDEHGDEPTCHIKCWKFCEWLRNFSRRDLLTGVYDI